MEKDVHPSGDLPLEAIVPAPLRLTRGVPAPPVRILVLDDTPGVVRGLAHLLRRDGYTVDTADNGPAGLTQLQAQRYDVLVCDVHMPDLTGPDLYAIVRRQYADLAQRVVFLTGDSLGADSTAFLAQCGQPWLLKPFHAAVIRRAIQQVLHAVSPHNAMRQEH